MTISYCNQCPASEVRDTSQQPLLLALALLLAKKARRLPLIPLVGFGWELQMSHAMPHGPIAFTLIFIAALLLSWKDRRAA